MLRRLVAIILLAAISWPFLSTLTPMSTEKQVIELTNIVVHGQGTDHHHHDDQSLHIDESGGAPQHIHADSELKSMGVLLVGRSSVAPIGSVAPRIDVNAFAPTVDLDGPLRPARLNS
jgi:hypothetical protein